MLLSKEQIKTLKQVDVSKNAEKTKERVAQDFKNATKEEKAAIVELTNQAISAVYRVFKTGAVNARIIVALSQVLNIEPWYYTGEIEERKPLDEAQLGQFLKVHGYDELLKELNKQHPEQHPEKRKYTRKPKPEVTTEKPSDAPVDAPTEVLPADPPSVVEPSEDMEDVLEVNIVFSDDEQMKKAVEELNEEDAVALLHTLFIRAKAGGEAAVISDVVKRCLLK